MGEVGKRGYLEGRAEDDIILFKLKIYLKKKQFLLKKMLNV